MNKKINHLVYLYPNSRQTFEKTGWEINDDESAAVSVHNGNRAYSINLESGIPELEIWSLKGGDYDKLLKTIELKW